MSKQSILWARATAIGACATLLACSGDDSSSHSSDSGATDGTIDGGVPDSAAESGTDAGSDGSIADAGSDAGDGSVDASGDGAADGGATADSASDAPSVSGDTGLSDGALSDAVANPGLAALAVPSSYTVRVFATGGTAYKGPDSLALDGTTVWVGYQMGVVGKAGEVVDSGPTSSMVVQYNLADGALTGKSFAITGHCDGVRVDPTTHVVWATSNEDGNPGVVSWNPTTAATTTYTIAAPTEWGGGLDDLQFLPSGKIAVVNSSPGTGSLPALSLMNISGTTITFSPLLRTDSMALNTVAVPAMSQALALTDPDSLAVDNQGNLVLVAQDDQELIIIRNPGVMGDAGAADAGDAGVQSVEVVPVSAKLDDTVWVTKATGMLLIADATTNTIYSVTTAFTPGTVYTVTPDDSNVPHLLGTVDFSANTASSATRGYVTPVIVGFKKATGMIFVPQ